MASHGDCFSVHLSPDRRSLGRRTICTTIPQKKKQVARHPETAVVSVPPRNKKHTHVGCVSKSQSVHAIYFWRQIHACSTCHVKLLSSPRGRRGGNRTLLFRGRGHAGSCRWKEHVGCRRADGSLALFCHLVFLTHAIPHMSPPHPSPSIYLDDRFSTASTIDGCHSLLDPTQPPPLP